MAEAKKASLTVLGGPLGGARCLLPDAGTVTVGSAAGSTLRLDAPGVSPLHVRLVVDASGATVHDTGAPSRVFVNDSAVEPGGVLLRNGDIIWLGTPGEDQSVMLQCLLPRRPVEPAPAPQPPRAVSPEVTMAAIPLPAEAFAPGPAKPTPEIETGPIGTKAAGEGATFALLPDEGETAATVVYKGGSAESDEFVFAEETSPGASDAAPAGDEDAIVVEAADLDTPDAATAPHVVVPDFEKAVSVEPEAVAEAQAAEDGEPTTFVAADEASFEETVDQHAPTVIVEPPAGPPAAPPPLPPSASQPAANPPPLPSHPSATHPPQARPPHVSHPEATRPPQARSPHASHPGARRGPARKGRSGSRGVLVAVGGLAAIAVVAGLGWAGWRYVWPRFSGAPSPETTPAPLAQATPAPDETAVIVPAEPVVPEAVAPSPTIEPTASPTAAAMGAPTAATPTAAPAATPTPRATPSPRTTPTPPAQQARPTPPPATTAPGGPSAETLRAQQAAQVQSLLDQADAALAARQYDAAIGHADGVLRLDAANARATTLRADASRRRDLTQRRFHAGRTVVQTQKAQQGGGLAGFDAGDADVRKAPDFQGRIDFEMSPASGLDAGAAWKMRIFVVNDGKKPIRVQGLRLTTNVNGSAAPVPVPVAAREIAPQQRALVGEASGSWREGITSWTSEATVTANKGDSLRNTLSWR